MDEIVIREATKNDLAAVMCLIAQPDMSPDTNLTVEQAEDIIRLRSLSGNQVLFVAIQNSLVVGTFTFILVQQLSHNAGKSAVLEDVVVGKQFQGRGIGQSMMRFAVNYAREHGCYKLVLSSGKNRTEAHEFYEKFGFQKHGFSFYLGL